VPDASGPFDTASFGQGPWFRDRGYLEPSGLPGPPPATTAAGDLPLSVNGLTVSVGLGRAHVRGAYYERTGTAWTVTVAANTNPTNNRVDRVVLRRDLAAKTVTPVMLQGTPASTPTAPALTQVENGVWEQPLYQFTVPSNSGTTIANIVDERRWIDQGAGRLITPHAKAMATTANAVILGADGVLGAYATAAVYDTGPGLYDAANKRFVVPAGWGGRWRFRGYGRWTGGSGNVGAFVVHRISRGAWPGTAVASDLRPITTVNETHTWVEWEDTVPAGQIVSFGYFATASQNPVNWNAEGWISAEYLGA
jgi:hypothetical protein